MTPDEIKKTIVEALSHIAPEIDAATIRTDADLREQLDLDSIDFLNFIVGLHDRLGVDIPESDYGRLSSLDAAVRYLVDKISDARNSRPMGIPPHTPR